MVHIKIYGNDFEQDVRPLIKAFFPERAQTAEHFEASDMQDCRTGDGAFLTIILVTEDKSFRIILGDICINESIESEADNESDYHRDYRNQLLRALYRACSEYTGQELKWGILTGVRPTKLLLERLEEGRLDSLPYMKKQYYCSEEKAVLAHRVAAKEMRLLNEMDYKNGYSLYVGIPFCPSICNYCSFGSHPIERFKAYIEPYIEALKKEISFASECFPERKLETVYFGGGTPTSLSAGQLRELIQTVKSCFPMENVAEFTVEAGRPDSVTEEKLRMLKEEGVTRISINPQSMVERTLEVIGRRHTPQQVIDAFMLARSLGFDNINMDLIAGLSGENPEDFAYTLGEVEKLNPDSITVHTLALKRAARLCTDKDKYAGLEAVNVSGMLELSAEYMRTHGYEPYYLYRQKNMTENLENVGYARPGKEGLYNILIMEEKQIILALGAGASSKFVFKGEKRFERVENVKDVAGYISRIDEMIERKRTFLGMGYPI